MFLETRSLHRSRIGGMGVGLSSTSYRNFFGSTVIGPMVGLALTAAGGQPPELSVEVRATFQVDGTLDRQRSGVGVRRGAVRLVAL